ncbi:hydantoinase/oxoprolinase family protein [Methylophilus sp. 5]|uniref:hydantoinase/oxoprolinase family protein n=1 Tax=Methylophilus sp. 5 TaxID=1112274 RepID=UPI00048C6F14|nr:hydantoinase/oxoprolinase family protein [Methylophilus sp. 5]
MKRAVIGWDIGGAHVKAVMLDAQGDIVCVLQQACALWKGLPLLEEAIKHVLHRWQITPEDCDHAVTMTGELVDLFDNRWQGVRAIAETVQAYLPQAAFYWASATDGAGFTAKVIGHEPQIASMNWHASAQCLATSVAALPALVIDIGSTTSDITLCDQQQVFASGWSDAERMASQGLLYTGVVRTPLMALGPLIAWTAPGQTQPVLRHIAAEYFATTADVYRLLGELPVSYDLAETADGQGRSMVDSMRRLARMVGHDVEDKADDVWQSLALAFKAAQLDSLQKAVQSIIVQAPKPPVTLIGLGAGSFLVAALAQRLALAYQPATAFMPAGDLQLKQDAEVCFPAYAVARLWQAWH